MLLNRIEKTLMNNPVRALVQKNIESNILLKIGGSISGLPALEIGCGRGVGAEIILSKFQASRLLAIDLDPHMIATAEQRVSKNIASRVLFQVASATAIPAKDESFDAVFDFGILHHIPDWQTAVGEVARVLKPNGKFFFEEVSKIALDTWPYRAFLDHPKENRFLLDEFIQCLTRHKLEVLQTPKEIFFGHFFIGVAQLN